jgi:hypothetical protein
LPNNIEERLLVRRSKIHTSSYGYGKLGKAVADVLEELLPILKDQGASCTLYKADYQVAGASTSRKRFVNAEQEHCGKDDERDTLNGAKHPRANTTQRLVPDRHEKEAHSLPRPSPAPSGSGC